MRKRQLHQQNKGRRGLEIVYVDPTGNFSAIYVNCQIHIEIAKLLLQGIKFAFLKKVRNNLNEYILLVTKNAFREFVTVF